MLCALGSWVVSRARRPLNQPTYLLFAVFIVLGMVTMVVNCWVGGALVRFLEFLPPLFALLLVAQASHSPKNCFRIMWMISLCAVVLTIHGIGQVRLGQGWTGMPTVQDGRIQYVGIFSDPTDLAMLFIMAFPMTLLMAGRGGLHGLRRVLWLAPAHPLLECLSLTNSRGPFLADSGVA